MVIKSRPLLMKDRHVWEVVYGYGQSHICGGAVKCYRKWRDRKWRQSRDRKWLCPEVCSAHAQPEVTMLGSMFCACATGCWAISALVETFDRKWRQLRDWKRPCPEVALTGSRFCACPAFLPRFFPLVVVTWLPEVTEGHLTPSEFPWVCVCATGSCASPVVVVNNVGWGVLHDVHVL
jgi:hypothetical protein